MHKFFVTLGLVLAFSFSLFAQVSDEIRAYRSEPYGNIQYKKEGIMDGNLVRTLFYNTTEVAQWPFSPSLEWPKGSGHNYCDGVALLLAAEISTPGGLVHPLETYYREWMDRDPNTGELWGLTPVPGYVNPSSENPAINTKPDSWPDTWPRALPNVDATWDAQWYGYFGRGVMNSDFETFFVVDDSKDGEFFRPPYNYAPVSDDANRKGLGLRVETRGFQWSHVLAEDIIFWHYDIVNLSDNLYNRMMFGFYTDTGVGGKDDNGDDCASFDTQLDIAYGYDKDGYGAPGRWITGYYGYAYLESPGNATNSVDDDEDGLIDERRDDGIDNDNDWVPFSDLNNNGQWDYEENEPLNNDVGQDGVGPFDPQWTAPDQGEGDGLPTNGEPNFDRTDKDESDQIGLTSVSIYRLGDGGTGGGWPKDDEQMWIRMQTGIFDTTLQNANISMVFASGPFPLEINRRERFSMALLFGSNLEDLIFNKETVQQIYNANYNFAKPPLKPTLTAVPGDGVVNLFWDSDAEESRDPFLGFEQGDPTLGFKKDFEGYLIYRSEEPEFNDIKTITDSKGEPKYWKPIAQFDIAGDGIYGPDPVGVNGAHFWRGDDKIGLAHSFIDTDVQNGKTYYYALVSYDMGDPAFGTKGLTPSECTKIISMDFAGNIKFVDINCAVVTPNAYAAGYIPPQIAGDVTKVAEGIGTGNLIVNLLNAEQIRENAAYKIEFISEGEIPAYTTLGYRLIRYIDGSPDTLFTRTGENVIGSGAFSSAFDGMVFAADNDTAVTVIPTKTGWLVGASTLKMTVTPDATSPARNLAWPSDYEIKWYDTDVATTPFFNIPVKFLVTNLTTGDTTQAEVIDNDGSGSLTMGDEIKIIEYVGTQYKITWRIDYYAPGVPNVQPKEPVPGDVFHISTTKPFRSGDYFSFSTKAADVDNTLAASSLKDIKVVPNPYIGAAEWEKRTLNQTGRGERRIDFIHLPADCTIRIYTITGQLVKTLDKLSAPTDGSMSWDLVSDDGMDIAFGLYIYHVDAPGIGEYIGKFAVIK